MNREEAIIDLKAKITRIKSILDDGLCANLDRWAIKLKWHEDVLSALHSPQPDPITGLVPCGCGGKAILEKGINYHSGYYVICEKCECNIGLDRDDFLRPFGAYPTAEQAVSDWNRAIGWKGGAE